jgi:hypothetical protein
MPESMNCPLRAGPITASKVWGHMRHQALRVNGTTLHIAAGPLSQWLHAGLKRAGFDTLLLETRHVKAALSAMMVKTDRKDARGLAQLIRMGWFRPVHAKSMGSQEVRALLANWAEGRRCCCFTAGRNSG